MLNEAFFLYYTNPSEIPANLSITLKEIQCSATGLSELLSFFHECVQSTKSGLLCSLNTEVPALQEGKYN